ncbi:Uncharacterised protein [Turicibacter sanguinis]|nr:Uncharacterised protein [Turicibacter sanguinis]
MIESKGVTLREYYAQQGIEKIKRYNELIQWTEDEFLEYERIYGELKEINDKGVKSKTNPHGVTAKEKGDALEKLVKFLFDKSLFFEIHANIHTDTNEIDQVVVFSDVGKQILQDAELHRGIIPIPTDMFVCECKNYRNKVGVTWVGKFYGLLTACSCNFGILFTVDGMTGDSEQWINAKGLLRTFHLIENLRNNQNFCIIDFDMQDFERILRRDTDFFSLIKAKIKGAKLGTSYEQFLEDCSHQNESKIKKIMNDLA